MEKLNLKKQLCFKFYALSRHITSLYKPLLDELELTYTQYLVMLVLWEKELVSVKEIGQLLMLDSGTLTPLLKRLEQKGLLNRSRSKEDERIVQVKLSEEGRKMKQKAACIPEQMMQGISLDAAELKQLNESLSKMMDQLPE